MPDAVESDMTAAELALGVLDGDDRSAALRRLLTDAAFARDVDEWRRRLAALFDDYAPVSAPAGHPPLPPAAADGSSYIQRKLWPIAAVPVALAAAIAALLISRPDPAPPAIPVERPHRTLLASLVTTDTARAVPVLVDLTTRRITISRADIAPAGKSAQLWAIGSDGVPKAIGLLSARGPSHIAIPDGGRRYLSADVTLAVSVEPIGGSPTGLPTGPVIASGDLLDT